MDAAEAEKAMGMDLSTGSEGVDEQKLDSDQTPSEMTQLIPKTRELILMRIQKKPAQSQKMGPLTILMNNY